MFKHKRTRVLLYILGGVLVVAIGLTIWGAASGRISTFADSQTASTSVFSLTGKVTDTSGAAVPRAIITLNQMNSATQKWTLIKSAFTDTSGKYDFSNIQTGYAYQVVASEVNGCHNPVVSRSFRGIANQTQTVDLRMKTYPFIKGRITYKDGTPAPVMDATTMTTGIISVHGFSTGSLYADPPLDVTIDNNGNYQVLCLDPKMTYKIYSSSEDRGPQTRLVRIYNPVPYPGATLNIVLPYNAPWGNPI